MHNKLIKLSSLVLNFGALRIMPKGYWIAHVDVHNHESYAKYREANALAFDKFGARFIVRGGKQIIEEEVIISPASIPSPIRVVPTVVVRAI